MFTQMAKLSESIKGNFDSLADALNDNLMEVLEELRDILKETNGIIEDKSKDNGSFGIMSSVSNNSTPISQSQPTNNTTNNTTKDNQSKPTDITPVIEKLESLLQQFKSGVPVYSKIGQPLQVRTT